MAASLTQRIRRHYDRLAPFYRRLWGSHVHHGYWDDTTEAREPVAAQERLIEVLAEAARLPRGATVLDVGCGFGGSARWLAEHRDARVLGWTLSRAQARSAGARARRREAAPPHGARRHGAWLITQVDAETWPARTGAFDVVWVIECLEHLTDKAGAYRRIAGTLRPGGVLALCAWMAGPGENGRTSRVAEAFLCPSLPGPKTHAEWARAAGLLVQTERDLTPHVRPTWEVCRRRLRAPWMRAAIHVARGDTRRFVRGFDEIAAAYDEGSLVYHLLIARKPPA